MENKYLKIGSVHVKQINEEVLYAEDDIVKVDGRDIESLKDQAIRNKRKRIRLCAHQGVDNKVHEMLIVHTKDTYVRPHKHLNKSESFHIIEGSADVVIFDVDGNILEVIPMGDSLSGKIFFYRMNSSQYHTLKIDSDYLVFHEITSGPFDPADTVFAVWAPDEHDLLAVERFKKRLDSK